MKIKMTTLRRVNSVNKMRGEKKRKSTQQDENWIHSMREYWRVLSKAEIGHIRKVSESHSKDNVEICKLSIKYPCSVIQILYH